MLFDIPYIADWYKIGEFRQKQTNINTDRENSHRCNFDYVVRGQVLVQKDGILRKSENRWLSTCKITQVHTNGTIRIQRGSRSEQLNIKRITLLKTARILLIGTSIQKLSLLFHFHDQVFQKWHMCMQLNTMKTTT